MRQHAHTAVRHTALDGGGWKKERCLLTWGALIKGSAIVVHGWQRWVLQM